MSATAPTGPADDAGIALALADSLLLWALGEDDRARLAAALQRVDFAPGDHVIREGAHDRDMYLVLSGEARILRGDLEVGALRRGELFGELGLVTSGPRAASIVAGDGFVAARLTPDAYGTIWDEHPGLALRLVEAIVGGLGARLTGMTENVSRLLRERSLPARTQIEIRAAGRKHEARTGTRVGDVLAPVSGALVVAGLVDRRAVSLGAPLSSDCEVEPLTTKHWEGRRIYQDSVALLLLQAAHRVDPGLDVRMEHSVGFARRVDVRGAGADLAALGARLQAGMEALAAEGATLREELWTVEEARAHFAHVGWNDAVELLRTWRSVGVPMVSYGAVRALGMGPLVPAAADLTGFRVVPDDGGLLLVFGGPGADPSAVADAALVARAASRHATLLTREHQRWLDTLGITSVGEFNHTCVRGDVVQLIRVAEGFHEKRIGQIADEIRDRGRDLKVVVVAGPSSSGKTTFIKRLKVQLQVNGIHPVGISLDDYYVDREQNPRDADGEYDYEAFEALRRDLFQEHVGRLLRGETVTTARYDFRTGRSVADGGPAIALRANDVLMLEGIHGLNPGLLAGVPADRVFRVFICPLSQLPFDKVSRVHASDLRLLRRIVRDRHGRGTSAAANILRWPSVRRGERKHIFPHQHHADAVFDSALIYENSVLKVFAERYLLEVPQEHPSYTTAFRLLGLLDRFVTLYPDQVPATSLLREFIGGSGFEA